ncbi:MAG: hypothetical protein JXA89_09100 [Anaerolineae bacterium]|nr:hypothetical protein [Anaerolineae bacterium]
MKTETQVPGTSNRAKATLVQCAQTVGSIALIALVTLYVYRHILFPPAGIQLYPWASDTLGHVIKAEYLAQQVAEGHYYPDLFPGWYVGVQMLRYYPPLPYYLLIAIDALTGNSIAAANWFIAVCALGGGLSWLLYRRWLGWLPATIGGALYAFLPDNVRVALAEGNLPRTLAMALLPLAVYFLLRGLEPDGKYRHRLMLSLCFATIVLCHAMMAAIYAACCALLALLYWAWRIADIKNVLWALSGIALGVMLSGWWLLPSLTGGITELDASAMTEALAVFPLATYLNPTLRLSNAEIVYPGAALLIVSTALLFVRRGRDGSNIALTLTGIFGILISTPGFNTLFSALPMSNLFWPLRFLGMASFALLLAVIWRIETWGRRSMLLTALVLLSLVADSALSLLMIHLRPANHDVRTIGQILPAQRGWREATLDYSKLGSAASYFFTAQGGREQLYGWAYQGARTARNVAAINEGLRRGYTNYVLDRLALMGADDVVLRHDAEIDPSLPAALEKAGFLPHYRGPEVTLYHRDGTPRAYRVTWHALGIGGGAQNLAYLFPQLLLGTRTNLDEYALDELTVYDTIFLSGFSWKKRQEAEQLVQQVARAGVNVVIDLTGVPDDPLAREPYFLGVWGETISLPAGEIQIEGDNDLRNVMKSFRVQSGMWQTYTPQGMDVEILYHDYLGAQSAVLGYNQYGAGRVWFVGLNLPYHAALTQDPAVIALLANLLALPAGEQNAYQAVPLDSYQPSQAGYSFTYVLDGAETLLVPVAHHDGTKVLVDEQPVRVTSFENLVAFDAPAGQHQVRTQIKQTPIYVLGQVVSGAALLSLVALFFLQRGQTGTKRGTDGQVE